MFEFNDHHNLAGCHAFLGASNYHWVNYTPEKLATVFHNKELVERGTRLHALAAECINLNVKLPKNNKTLNAYVNDAIGYRLKPEVILYYSPNAFGTADAIGFKNDFLRIHDLKTGETAAHMEQLMIYAALFCLEYRMNPLKLQYELRIYQHDAYEVCTPTGEEVQEMMDKIVAADRILNELQEG